MGSFAAGKQEAAAAEVRIAYASGLRRRKKLAIDAAALAWHAGRSLSVQNAVSHARPARAPAVSRPEGHGWFSLTIAGVDVRLLGWTVFHLPSAGGR